MRNLVIFLILPIAGNLWGRPKTDVIVMNNGDRLTCEIKKLERGVLYAGFDYVDGTVAIEWSKVMRIESSQLFLVHTQEGSIYEGTLRTAKTPAEQPVTIEILETQQKPEAVERGRIVEMSQTSQSFWRRLSGTIDSGLMFNKGNDTAQYNIGSDVYVRRERWSGQANFAAALSSSAGADVSTRNQLGFRGLRFIGERKWFYAGLADFLQSSQQGIKLQTTLGGGIGRFVKDTNRARIAISSGLGWQETRYRDSNDSNGPSNVMTGMVLGSVHLFQVKKRTFDINAALFPAITQAGRLRFNTNASYAIQIVSNLWWKFSFYGNWDNRPPPTFSGTDSGTSSSISWSFN